MSSPSQIKGTKYKKLHNNSFALLCLLCLSLSVFPAVSVKGEKKHSPFMNKRSTVLTHRLPLLAQTALLSTWIILVLRRRADRTEAAAAAAATVLLQVSV